MNTALWIIGIPLLVLGLLEGLYMNWGGSSFLQDKSEGHSFTFMLGLFGLPALLILGAIFLVLVGIKLFRG